MHRTTQRFSSPTLTASSYSISTRGFGCQFGCQRRASYGRTVVVAKLKLWLDVRLARSCGEVVVEPASAVACGQGRQDIDITRVGAPGRDVHFAEQDGVDWYNQCAGFVVGESLNVQESAQLLESASQPCQILGACSGERIKVAGGPSSSVQSGSDPAHDEVLDVVSIKALCDALYIEVDVIAGHVSDDAAARRRASSARNAWTASTESRRWPSAVIDTSSAVRGGRPENTSRSCAEFHDLSSVVIAPNDTNGALKRSVVLCGEWKHRHQSR